MLICQNLAYQIEGKSILTDINFTLEPGQNLLIFGPSGCGKTTLLCLLAGLLQPTTGEVIYNGTHLYPLTSRKRDQFRGQSIGIIFQKFHLIEVMTLQQNLMLAQEFSGQSVNKIRILELLDRLGLADKINYKVNSLSVGQAQRVAVARALVTNPQWILCDELTSALDDYHTQAMLQLLTEEARLIGASLIIVTHDIRVKNYFKGQTKILELSANPLLKGE